MDSKQLGEKQLELARLAVDYLNELLATDPVWLKDLLTYRPVCNQAIANHPTCIVGYVEEYTEDGRTYIPQEKQAESQKPAKYRGGFLGLLNGMCLMGERSTGPVAYEYDHETGDIKYFLLNKQYEGSSNG